MTEPVTVVSARDKTLNGLLLAALLLCGVVLLKEGPQYDNVIDGWRFFTLAFFAGGIAGFIGWTRSFNLVPALKLSGAYRQPWLAALVAALLTCVVASWINRTFTTATDRSLHGAIDTLEEGKGDRWHVGVKLDDGRYEKYLINKETAERLKGAKALSATIVHGALGFDVLSAFVPADATVPAAPAR